MRLIIRRYGLKKAEALSSRLIVNCLTCFIIMETNPSENSPMAPSTSLRGTVKPVLRGHSKIDKIKGLKTNGSLMKVRSITECSLGAFCNTFDLH